MTVTMRQRQGNEMSSEETKQLVSNLENFIDDFAIRFCPHARNEAHHFARQVMQAGAAIEFSRATDTNAEANELMAKALTVVYHGGCAMILGGHLYIAPTPAMLHSELKDYMLKHSTPHTKSKH